MLAGNGANFWCPKPSIKSWSTEMPLLMLLWQKCKDRLDTDKKKSYRKWNTQERFKNSEENKQSKKKWLKFKPSRNSQGWDWRMGFPTKSAYQPIDDGGEIFVCWFGLLTSLFIALKGVGYLIIWGLGNACEANLLLWW